MTNPDRNQRLAAKLRENLKRRKAQAKARQAHETNDKVQGKDDDAQAGRNTTGRPK
ncbi:hypothetical protein [Pelagibacterium halotolerans]|uniref:hypothetical protein n=1 Tax=Pelagibacterium halotolerans TaxID=531813 RepID=UPI00384CB6EF